MMPILKAAFFALLISFVCATASAPKAAADPAADKISNGVGAYGAPTSRIELAEETRQAMQSAQADVQIPSTTQLDRMEREDIARPPLDVSGSPIPAGSERNQIRRMDRQDRIIDDKVMRGICSDC